MMMVDKFIIQVCLYGERGMPDLPSGQVCGQSVHGGEGPPVGATMLGPGSLWNGRACAWAAARASRTAPRATEDMMTGGEQRPRGRAEAESERQVAGGWLAAAARARVWGPLARRPADRCGGGRHNLISLVGMVTHTRTHLGQVQPPCRHFHYFMHTSMRAKTICGF